MELLERLRVAEIAAGLGVTLGAHGCDTEGAHVVADVRRFACGVADVDVVVEDAEGESELCELLVGHDDIGLEAAVLALPHAREVDTVLRLPIVLFEVSEMESHHAHVGSPLLETDEDTHADGVDAGHAHAVEAIDAPLEVALHAARMIDFIVLAVIGLLEADDTIHAAVGDHLVVLGGERHDLNLDVAEVLACDVDRAGDVLTIGLCGVLTRDDENVLEWAELLDGLVLILNLLLGEDCALHGVADMETAVDTGVGARVGYVERYEHLYGVAETLQSVLLAETSHLLEKRLGGWRDEGLEVLPVATLLAECAEHVGLRLGIDALGSLLPRDIQ